MNIYDLFDFSLKSESELLDPEKATVTEKKSFARKSLDEDKCPPDPIVTISKVGNMKDSKELVVTSEKLKPALTNSSSSPGPQLQSPASCRVWQRPRQLPAPLQLSMSDTTAELVFTLAPVTVSTVSSGA